MGAAEVLRDRIWQLGKVWRQALKVTVVPHTTQTDHEEMIRMLRNNLSYFDFLPLCGPPISCTRVVEPKV